MQDALARPTFADVARSISKGKSAPEWLPQALEHFSAFVGTTPTAGDERKDLYEIVERTAAAADVLMSYLPLFSHLPLGPTSPNWPDANTVLEALPRIKKALEKAMSHREGRPPNIQREVCAAVVLAVWRMIHGKPQPRSGKLEQACADYWQVCGGEPIGEINDPVNWRRVIERALHNNHIWAQEILISYSNS